jgi:photosystem II stability/assembly factor-like uncharacterized protein
MVATYIENYKTFEWHLLCFQHLCCWTDDVILTAPEFVGASYNNTWTAKTSNTTNLLYTVAYSNNTFVAVGDGGKILRSTNKGVSWTAQLLALRRT